MKPSTLLSFMNAISRYSFLLTIIILPFFFIPFFSINSIVVKGALLAIGMTVSILSYAIARFIDGEMAFPKTRINLALMFVVLATFFSALFSPSFYKSMFGLSFEVGTFASLFALILIYFLGVKHTISAVARKYIVRSIFAVFFVSLAIVVASFFFGNNNMFVDLFKGFNGSTLVGSWTDYSILAAVVVLLSVLYSSVVGNSLLKNVFYWVSVLLGLSIISLVNIMTLWVLVGVLCLVFFVYAVSLTHRPGFIENNQKSYRLPVLAFVVVVFCILFTVGNSVFGNLLSTKIGFSNAYVQPSFKSTISVYRAQSVGNPLRAIVGSGPARFTEAWMRFKPLAINETNYWDTPFYSGFGNIVTTLVTTGAIGFIAWVFFLFIYFVIGIRVLFAQLKTENIDNTLISYFFVSAFLWLINIFIASNITILVITFVMTAVFVGALISRNIIEFPASTYLKDPRNSFFVILLLVSVMVGSIVSLYFSSVKLLSVVYFTKATNSSSFESSEKYMLYATKLQNKNDLYYRTLTSLYINQINNLIVKDKNAPNLQNSVQSLVYSAQRNATQSVATDSNNYSNWLLLGQFFEFTTNMQIAGDSYKNGMVAYDKVAYFVPASPSIPVYQARLELANKNVQGAQDLITKALSLKKDYSEAFKLRAQIAYDAKDNKEAINQLSQAISYNPDASDLYLSRGAVYMQINSYTDAVNDYRKALSISPSQNIGFLLAQADIKAGFTDEAKTIIDALLKLNPDNNDLKDMKQRLQEPNTAKITDQPSKDTKKVDTKK